jgi:hypothetical protein
MNLNQQ